MSKKSKTKANSPQTHPLGVLLRRVGLDPDRLVTSAGVSRKVVAVAQAQTGATLRTGLVVPCLGRECNERDRSLLIATLKRSEPQLTEITFAGQFVYLTDATAGTRIPMVLGHMARDANGVPTAGALSPPEGLPEPDAGAEPGPTHNAFIPLWVDEPRVVQTVCEAMAPHWIRVFPIVLEDVNDPQQGPGIRVETHYSWLAPADAPKQPT